MNYGQALSLGNTKLKSKMEPTEALLTENAGTPVFKKQTHETSTTCKGVLPITEQDRVNQQYRMQKSYKVLMFNGPMGCSLKVMCSRRHEKETKNLCPCLFCHHHVHHDLSHDQWERILNCQE
jgi:hypothetical protein